MFALRSISTKTATVSRVLSASFNGIGQRMFSSSEFETGEVKFFSMNKAYGFIKSDVDNTDIFVHRNSIAGVSSESDDRYTMLKAGERVRFKRADNDGKEHGVEVTFEDGSQVPSFRPGHADRVTLGSKRKLGYQVYEILTNKGDEDNMAQAITEAFNECQRNIDQAIEAEKSNP